MSAPARTQLEGLGLSASCADVLRHLWDYLDDEMTPRGADRLRAHIVSCAQCQDLEVYQSCFLDTLAQLRMEFDAPTELRQRLADTLRTQGCGCWQKVRRES